MRRTTYAIIAGAVTLFAVIVILSTYFGHTGRSTIKRDDLFAGNDTIVLQMTQSADTIVIDTIVKRVDDGQQQPLTCNQQD